jgi:hypothetical protein
MQRSRGRVVAIVCSVFFGLAIFATIATPNLMRSRMAGDEAAFYGKMRSATPNEAPVSRGPASQAGSGPVPMSLALKSAGDNGKTTPGTPESADFAANHKIIRTAKLELRMRDVRRAVDDAQAAATALGGYVEKAEFSDGGSEFLSAIVTVRVPQTKLELALAGFKQSSTRVERETIESRDVTREFVDTEARVRNFRAQEAQYLTILRRASTVRDTLEVSEKVSEVRGEIESMQGQLNYLSHEVEMSTITLGLRPHVTTRITALEWHPLVKARAAARDMLAGLADYADTMIAMLVNVPLVLVWLGTIGLALFAGWRGFRWMRPRVFAQKPSEAK